MSNSNPNGGQPPHSGGFPPNSGGHPPSSGGQQPPIALFGNARRESSLHRTSVQRQQPTQTQNQAGQTNLQPGTTNFSNVPPTTTNVPPTTTSVPPTTTNVPPTTTSVPPTPPTNISQNLPQMTDAQKLASMNAEIAEYERKIANLKALQERPQVVEIQATLNANATGQQQPNPTADQVAHARAVIAQSQQASSMQAQAPANQQNVNNSTQSQQADPNSKTKSKSKGKKQAPTQLNTSDDQVLDTGRKALVQYEPVPVGCVPYDKINGVNTRMCGSYSNMTEARTQKKKHCTDYDFWVWLSCEDHGCKELDYPNECFKSYPKTEGAYRHNYCGHVVCLNKYDRQACIAHKQHNLIAIKKMLYGYNIQVSERQILEMLSNLDNNGNYQLICTKKVCGQRNDIFHHVCVFRPYIVGGVRPRVMQIDPDRALQPVAAYQPPTQSLEFYLRNARTCDRALVDVIISQLPLGHSQYIADTSLPTSSEESFDLIFTNLVPESIYTFQCFTLLFKYDIIKTVLRSRHMTICMRMVQPEKARMLKMLRDLLSDQEVKQEFNSANCTVYCGEDVCDLLTLIFMQHEPDFAWKQPQFSAYYKTFLNSRHGKTISNLFPADLELVQPNNPADLNQALTRSQARINGLANQNIGDDSNSLSSSMQNNAHSANNMRQHQPGFGGVTSHINVDGQTLQQQQQQQPGFGGVTSYIDVDGQTLQQQQQQQPGSGGATSYADPSVQSLQQQQQQADDRRNSQFNNNAGSLNANARISNENSTTVLNQSTARRNLLHAAAGTQGFSINRTNQSNNLLDNLRSDNTNTLSDTHNQAVTSQLQGVNNITSPSGTANQVVGSSSSTNRAQINPVVDVNGDMQIDTTVNIPYQGYCQLQQENPSVIPYIPEDFFEELKEHGRFPRKFSDMSEAERKKQLEYALYECGNKVAQYHSYVFGNCNSYPNQGDNDNWQAIHESKRSHMVRELVAEFPLIHPRIVKSVCHGTHFNWTAAKMALTILKKGPILHFAPQSDSAAERNCWMCLNQIPIGQFYECPRSTCQKRICINCLLVFFLQWGERNMLCACQNSFYPEIFDSLKHPSNTESIGQMRNWMRDGNVPEDIVAQLKQSPALKEFYLADQHKKMFLTHFLGRNGDQANQNADEQDQADNRVFPAAFARMCGKRPAISRDLINQCRAAPLVDQIFADKRQVDKADAFSRLVDQRAIDKYADQANQVTDGVMLEEVYDRHDYESTDLSLLNYDGVDQMWVVQVAVESFSRWNRPYPPTTPPTEFRTDTSAKTIFRDYLPELKVQDRNGFTVITFPRFKVKISDGNWRELLEQYCRTIGAQRHNRLDDVFKMIRFIRVEYPFKGYVRFSTPDQLTQAISDSESDGDAALKLKRIVRLPDGTAWQSSLSQMAILHSNQVISRAYNFMPDAMLLPNDSEQSEMDLGILLSWIIDTDRDLGGIMQAFGPNTWSIHELCLNYGPNGPRIPCLQLLLDPPTDMQMAANIHDKLGSNIRELFCSRLYNRYFNPGFDARKLFIHAFQFTRITFYVHEDGYLELCYFLNLPRRQPIRTRVRVNNMDQLVHLICKFGIHNKTDVEFKTSAGWNRIKMSCKDSSKTIVLPIQPLLGPYQPGIEDIFKSLPKRLDDIDTSINGNIGHVPLETPAHQPNHADRTVTIDDEDYQLIADEINDNSSIRWFTWHQNNPDYGPNWWLTAAMFTPQYCELQPYQDFEHEQYDDYQACIDAHPDLKTFEVFTRYLKIARQENNYNELLRSIFEDFLADYGEINGIILNGATRIDETSIKYLWNVFCRLIPARQRFIVRDAAAFAIFAQEVNRPPPQIGNGNSQFEGQIDANEIDANLPGLIQHSQHSFAEPNINANGGASGHNAAPNLSSHQAQHQQQQQQPANGGATVNNSAQNPSSQQQQQQEHGSNPAMVTADEVREAWQRRQQLGSGGDTGNNNVLDQSMQQQQQQQLGSGVDTVNNSVARLSSQQQQQQQHAQNHNADDDAPMRNDNPEESVSDEGEEEGEADQNGDVGDDSNNDAADHQDEEMKND